MRKSVITVEVSHDDKNKKVKNIMKIDDYVVFENEMSRFFGALGNHDLVKHFTHALYEIEMFDKFEPERYDKMGDRNVSEQMQYQSSE